MNPWRDDGRAPSCAVSCKTSSALSYDATIRLKVFAVIVRQLKHVLVSLVALLIFSPGPAHSAETAPPERPVTQYVQSWLGGVDTDEDWALRNPEDAERLIGGLGTVPLVGGAGQRLWGESRQFGFEGGGLVSWKNDRVTFFAESANGRAEIEIDNSFLMLETFFAGVAGYRPTPWLRTYLAGGAAIAWGFLDDEDVDEDDRFAAGGRGSGFLISISDVESDFSISPYVRAGIEFEFGSGFAVGASARYLQHEFDFGPRGELKVDGVQWFLVFSQRL